MTKESGYTLVEVVISILLTAVMVSSVLGVALTSKQGGGKADRKVLGSQSAAALSDALKGYVTADTAVTTINGPNFHNRGANNVNTWHIDSPGIQEDWQCNFSACSGTFGGCAPTLTAHTDGYALATGTHCLKCVAGTAAGQDATCFLPKILREPPYNGYVFYTVQAGSPPQVQVGVWWNEP